MRTQKPARCISVLGTGSDVGKSVVAAALCRIFSNRGIKVAPYKAQNMSNNSFVTAQGGEIGRAQAMQAECARLAPHVDMNPLLLKPSGDNRSQMVLHGAVVGEITSSEFRNDRSRLFAKVQESLNRLRSENELVVIEGAGSCAEVNLRDFDIANFRTALACDATVILVADISRGGVFAQILGTLDLLGEEERKLVRGLVINRFRGDASLFVDGVEFLQKRSGLPVLGVIPYFNNIELDSEDSVMLEELEDPKEIIKTGMVNIATIRLPHISNFTDFSPLMREHGVNLSYLSRPRSLGGISLLILPGSKNTISDMGWLKKTGWDKVICEYASGGGNVVGICGGYQMLGISVSDPHGVEGEKGSSIAGLGLLGVETVLSREKRLTKVTGVWREGGYPLCGYEIHMGITDRKGLAAPVEIDNDGKSHLDGAMSPGGKVWGTYLHGIFDEPKFRNDLLKRLGVVGGYVIDCSLNPVAYKDAQYEFLAGHFQSNMDMENVMKIIGIGADLGKG